MVQVRTASRNDSPVIVEFQVSMALETEEVALDPAVVSQGVLAVFDDHTKGCYYVAETEGAIIGSLLTTYEWSDWRNGTVLWIQSVYVLPAYRRLGTYRKLYAHIREMVNGNPALRGIRLYADKNNRTAHQVYVNLGMNPDHYRTYEWMKDSSEVMTSAEGESDQAV